MADEKPLYPGFGSGSWFDQKMQTRLRRLETGAPKLRRGSFSPTSGQYSRIAISAVNDINAENPRLDLANTVYTKHGSVPPSSNTYGFAYTATANSITWYWDGTNSSKVLVLHRADSSTYVIPTSGSPITISGLVDATDYYFLTFWSPQNLCNLGWVPGTVGTPQIAFLLADTQDVVNSPIYLMQQQLQNREPLTAGFMKATTGAGGSGHGPPSCVMSGTDIETVGDLPYSTEVLEETEWIALESETGQKLACTWDHPLYTEDGKTTADELTVGDRLIMNTGIRKLVSAGRFERKCSKWKIIMPEGHLFWANGFLSHNSKTNQV